jgi:hypothetical protein
MERIFKISRAEVPPTEKQSDPQMPIVTFKTSNELERAEDSKCEYREANQPEAEERSFLGKVLSSFY